MKLKSQFLLIVFFTFGLCYSQNMQEGFDYLESGNYSSAEAFFETILKEYPQNKTARLCYGRAIGLNGEATKAVALFTELLNDYPSDFEIKLNFAEALLWDKKYASAKDYYAKLVSENDQSFPALLGYANTLSNLKIFDQALLYVNKALEVSPGNQNALISKKYIHLGYANEFLQNQDFDESERLLTENLKIFENDKETLLNLANLYLISNELEKAKATYETLSEKPENKLIALNGLALVSHLNRKDKSALTISRKAHESLESTMDTLTINQTKERYIQALIWNKKFKEATRLINSLIAEKPNENWVLALRATLNIYKSDFKKSVTDYDQILINDSTSFDGNLGKANALKALGYYDDAYRSANTTLSIFKNQKDAVKFITELDKSYTPFYETRLAYSFDNGDNEAYSLQNNITFPLSTKFKILGNYNYRTTSNKVTNNEAKSNDFSFGLTYQFIPQITFKGLAGITSVNANSDAFTNLLSDISLNIKPFKLQVLDVGYKRQTENFNAALLERKLIQNSLYLNYNLSSNFNFGWFVQFINTSQSDNNTRNLLFTSLYYNITSDPALKAGINYQYIAFKDQVPTIYFSPERFNVVEIFVNLLKNQNSKLFYSVDAATGFQFIDNNKKQSTFRFQGKLGYTFSERLIGNVFGQYSDIASATAAGFNFTEIGIQLKWYLFKLPVFKKK